MNISATHIISCGPNTLLITAQTVKLVDTSSNHMISKYVFLMNIKLIDTKAKSFLLTASKHKYDI